MPFALLLLAFLLYVQDPWAEPQFEATALEAVLLTLLGYGTFLIAAAFFAVAARVHLKSEPYDRMQILKRFATRKRRLFLAMAAFFVVSLYVLGWGWGVNAFLPGVTSPLVKPLVMTPLLIVLVSMWAFSYDIDRIAHGMIWVPGDHAFLSRREYVLLNVRHNLILLVPPLVMMVIHDALQIAFPELQNRDQFPLLSLGLLVGMMTASILFIPWLLRMFLGLTPLPDGEIRDRLVATARRIGFRFSDVLVWDTRGTLANALVTGVMPYLRYVVLTDRILRDLTVDEIESVFGHEVGHVKHHHMGLYAIFLILSLVALGAAWKLGVDLGLAYLAPEWPWTRWLLDRPEWFLGVVIVYVFLAFGLLSRNCERQADLFGCNVASRDAFIRALEKVADINGMSREKPGIFTAWQHWTISQRVDFLRRIDSDPSLEPRTQRRIGMLKWSLTLGLAAAIAVLLWADPWSWLRYL